MTDFFNTTVGLRNLWEDDRAEGQAAVRHSSIAGQ